MIDKYDEGYRAGMQKMREVGQARIEELTQALEEAVYLLNPTDEDMQKKAGVYRIVTALEKLKEKNNEVEQRK